jgi:hypothetical protein
MKVHKITESYTEWFSVCQNIIWILNFDRPPRLQFLFAKIICLKVVRHLEVLSAYTMSWPHVDWWMFGFHLRIWTPPFWNGWNYEIKKYSVEVTLSGMTYRLNL